MSTAMDRRIVVNEGMHLAVFETGNPDGETIVLVHGWPDTHELWSHIVPLLADDYRVVSYDVRGAGESTIPQEQSAYRLRNLASDFYAVIDAVSPDRKVHVLAHDWGAVQAWEAAAEPHAIDRIASYTSISGPNLDHLGKWSRSRLAKPTVEGIRHVLAQVRASWYTVTFHIPGLSTLRIKRQFAKGWPAFLQEFSGVDPALVTQNSTLWSDATNGTNLYRANIIPRLTKPRERYVDIPVQLIVNTEDVAVRPYHYADTGKWVKNLTRNDIPAGHWSPISHARDIAELTKTYIAGLGR
ncbi:MULTISPECIES: alpha/beta fold hydrolase [Nocardiaceae]|jgi:pimeloyl-ACP methyl ester carboxylesterase|uniref:alpha/beta fold hydrolase n=1 Tax=Nocardiaceae TaxID=85025 RepID=UPI000566CB9C|nr:MULTISPECIES: alpha/beta fold hydrolase [Rhodococcus]OZF03471.1 alpha/beta hydrolase [Rhodococcus sp. 15-1189-1-1a]OZF17275.1 alpha/beta hydrolase [Rhodococcus sp. 14-2686-1-2]OZF54817.1 alpha/beta hydrolase [Rhodococcus sp. 14-2470-1b]